MSETLGPSNLRDAVFTEDSVRCIELDGESRLFMDRFQDTKYNELSRRKMLQRS